VGAGAYSYMNLMGLVSIGLMWLRMGLAADAALAGGAGDAKFYEAKLITARFYAERLLPDAGALRRKIEGGAESIMALDPEMFRAA
jgi:Acetyl-CoA dehydrogenase C-terminal like